MPVKKLPLYLPALKWKQGEHLAVSKLTVSQKKRMQPIAELPDRPYDWGKGQYSKSWDKHVQDLVKATVKNWGTFHELAVDQGIDEDQVLSTNPGTPWEFVFSEMWDAKVIAVPVLSNRASASEQAALMRVSKAYGNSRWLLRYRSEIDGVVPDASQAETWFKNAAVVLGGKHGQIDAVLDIGHLAGEPKGLAVDTAQALKVIAAIGPWRQVALMSGGFPINLAGVQKGTKQFPRHDFDLFKKVAVRPELAGIDLAYGDYCMTHVEAFDNDPRKMVMSANLRYTHWNEWQVLKGRSVRDYGYAQYKDLCQILVALPIYLQPPFSSGDANYDKVANDPMAGPGNATQWRRDATNHHIHVVLHQLANHPEF